MVQNKHSVDEGFGSLSMDAPREDGFVVLQEESFPSRNVKSLSCH